MSLINNSDYLQQTQYRTSNNLTARANLHVRFSANQQGWVKWLFDHLALQPGQRVLEVGGGPGWLWRENIERLPSAVRVCFSDFSPGMVREAAVALAADSRFAFANLDAQALPFPSASFDVVTANHMLYHVPQVERAARELARVLKPGGRLIAATNGQPHLQEMHALLKTFEPHYSGHDPAQTARRFGLENGPTRLGTAFAQAEVRRYPDSLWITEAQPLTDYVLSLWDVADAIPAHRAADLTDFFQRKIDSEGGIRITKDSGVIIAFND